jgi:splicing factor 3B subunit 1
MIQDTPTPSASKRKSRWDETPAVAMTPQTPATPMTPHTPSMMTPSGVTPMGPKAMAMATPSPSKPRNILPWY